jgi:hypothetical protein
MTTGLEPALAHYFASTNERDVAEMVAAFAEGAVVRDEGREHRGLTAIRSWIEATIEKYDYRVDPIDSSRIGAKTIVRVSVHGGFPGSPITLRYEFTVDSQKIARLEIS